MIASGMDGMETITNIIYNQNEWTVGTVVALLVSSLIQVSPIKWHPWTSLLQWVGKGVNHDVIVKLDETQCEIENLQNDFRNKKLDDMRWTILSFARTCRNKEVHSREQWEYVLNQAKQYEECVKEFKIRNGVVEEDTRYIREVYHELSKEGRL